MKPTYKQIWLITYPILISLLMENLIGLAIGDEIVTEGVGLLQDGMPITKKK